MDEFIPPIASDRDGTSQAQRLLAALQADYVGIDEHSFQDQLIFAHAFAKELKYFNSGNVEAGDWQGLFNPEGLEGKDFTAWLQQIEDFIKQPENFADERFYLLHRPHFVLYLTFLQLLKNTQGQLNQLTARHLDFYYHKVLNFKNKPSEPDRVNILVTPSTQVNSALLPAGTLLAAGKDSLGKELVYRTDSDLVVNHTNIARLSSVYVNKQVTGIREAREQHTGTYSEAVMEMLKMALGDPAPGDALPPYPSLTHKENTELKFDLLTQLQNKLLKFVSSGLFMELGELRNLIKLKNNRGADADSDWETINSILQTVGTNRAGKSFTLTISNPRDFDSNLKTALGVDSLADYFDLPLVKNITELYEQRTREDVKAFITGGKDNRYKNSLHLDIDSFNKMMQIKVRIDNEWRGIYALLERAGAGKRNQTEYQLAPMEPPDFEKIFQSALGTPVYPQLVPPFVKINDLDSFYKALLDIEAYFFMTLEDFGSLMDAAGNKNTSVSLWANVYDKLALAHQKKVFAAHKAQLINLLESRTPADAAQAMMQTALGIPVTDTSDLVNRIKAFLPENTDLFLLEKAAIGAGLSVNDWDSIGSQLELAWRNRVPIPLAQKSKWLSISSNLDTLTAKVPGSNDASHWYTFGQRHAQTFTVQSQPPTTPTLGWAISSPLLCLAQGQRTVTLTLAFKTEQFNTEKISELLTQSQPFCIELSTAKGWITAPNVSIKVSDYSDSATIKPLKSLSWTLTFDESAPAISALPDTGGNGLIAPWPIVRLLLQARWDAGTNNYVTDYPLFQGLLLDKVLLAVDVKGLTECKLQNDEQMLPPGKPFEPFGTSPALGARLCFAHPELMLKKLEKLEIALQWMGVPSDKLGEYYKTYSATTPDKTTTNTDSTATITGNTSFKSKIALVDKRLEMILDKEAALFDDKNAKNPATLKIDNVASKIGKNYHYERQLIVSSEEDVTAWPRYWFLELSACDFQHTIYPSVAAANSIKLAAAIANKETIKADDYKVNPPYTPKLKSFSINYSASIELNVTEPESEGTDQVYHLHPFGYEPAQFDRQAGGYRFLPSYDNEGELYIGLSGVQAPQTLSMLLQMAEGTANPDLEAATVEWSVLSGNRWLTLDQGQLQQDATKGLLQSGIIKLQLDAVTPSTLLPSELYWLRVAIAERCDSVCDSIGIDTQAVTATFFNQDNAEDHLNQPLPADSIQSLVMPIAAIASVRQPYTSVGAKPKEQDSRFNTRISERLRHKQRALTHWDYERLVLEQFPEIYKAKCIPPGLHENQGLVTVVVIPDVRNRLPFNPFEPKAPAGVLAEIEAYLSALAPLGARIKVKNAFYRPVKLRFAVQFQPGCDSSFYKQQLNEEVNHFLSPWAYEQGKDIVIGGKIYANAIIDFIERRSYVDYVAHFKLFLGDENGTGFKVIDKPPLNDSTEGYAISANRPDGVLVAARNHEIDLITEIKFGEQIFNNGINYMKIELDFEVG